MTSTILTIIPGAHRFKNGNNVMKTLDEIAYENGLDLISTTSESNGYPSHIQEAIIGFESYEEAKAIADANDLSIEHFEKRDGWNLWYRTNNTAYHDYELTAEDYGDNYEIFTKDDIATFQEDEIDAYINDYDEDEQEEFINSKNEILEMLKQMDDDEAVLTNAGYYFETIKRHTMSYYEDVTTYTIGLIER